MADITVDITISVVAYQAWLRTSYISKEDVRTVELGPDQKDAFDNFMDEACREVLKLFVSRQGDAAGVPFEKTATSIIYRFKEGEPVLPQKVAIEATLAEDVKNALYTYVTLLWFSMRENETQLSLLAGKYEVLSNSIETNLYRLHD